MVKNVFLPLILIVGDTINIIYSTQRPVINEVIRSALTPAVW